MIITVKQLKLIHYFYFVIGIFGLTNAILLGVGSLFSLIFLGFYIANSGVSWYIAYVARRKMRDYLVVQSSSFFVNHTLLTLVTVALTIAVWVSGLITDLVLLNSLLLINFYVLFMAGMWYALTRTDFVSELFSVYDNFVFGRSKEFIIGIKRKNRGIFGSDLVTDKSIRDYKYGTIQEVDYNLVTAWKNRKNKKFAIECMGRIQLTIASKAIDKIQEDLFALGGLPDRYENQKLIKQTKEEIKRRERDLMYFERNFYKKTEQPSP
jgi:hypothetical protein